MAGIVVFDKAAGGSLAVTPQNNTTNKTILLPDTGMVMQVTQSLTTAQETYSIGQGLSGPWSSLVGTLTLKTDSPQVLVNINLDGLTWTSDNSYGSFYVYRTVAGTDSFVHRFGYPRGWSSVDNSSGTTMHCSFIDTPSLSAGTAVSYRFYYVSHSGTSNFNINRDSAGRSTMILTEVSA